jgi:hypothetical protein
MGKERSSAFLPSRKHRDGQRPKNSRRCDPLIHGIGQKQMQRRLATCYPTWRTWTQTITLLFFKALRCENKLKLKPQTASPVLRLGERGAMQTKQPTFTVILTSSRTPNFSYSLGLPLQLFHLINSSSAFIPTLLKWVSTISATTWAT